MHLFQEQHWGIGELQSNRANVKDHGRATQPGGRKQKTYEPAILDKPQQKWNIIPSLLCSGSYYEDLKKQFKSNDKSCYRSQLPQSLVCTALAFKNHCELDYYVKYLTMYQALQRKLPFLFIAYRAGHLQASDLNSGQRPTGAQNPDGATRIFSHFLGAYRALSSTLFIHLYEMQTLSFTMFFCLYLMTVVLNLNEILICLHIFPTTNLGTVNSLFERWT